MSTDGHRHVVLLLGAPGAGKGTQARFLSETLGIPHVASGDLLREHRRRGTELGQAAQVYMDRGDLVPDRLVIDMVIERLEQCDASRGALLDGFPRTAPQAEALDRTIEQRGGTVRAAVYLDVPKEILVQRLAGRWICNGCQATYHERFSPPDQAGVCNTCGGELYQRADDRREVVENRVEVYLRETLPVIEHYAFRGGLHRVDGNLAIEAVRARLCAAFGGVVHGRRRNRWHLFIEHEPVADGTVNRWLGRTLCGKYVDRDATRQLGSAAAFEDNPCRECWRELRTHQGPTVEAPAANSVVPISSMIVESRERRRA
jgi:adenylate kinase